MCARAYIKLTIYLQHLSFRLQIACSAPVAPDPRLIPAPCSTHQLQNAAMPPEAGGCSSSLSAPCTPRSRPSSPCTAASLRTFATPPASADTDRSIYCVQSLYTYGIGIW
ncbi:hypothetical protein MSAN_01326200 [Mycena sanguinolenta]|uniref:Uncharacterized protein n=1 Tax=Mycena sanguinolenta TaxID=230812 RepID=A0A8H6YF09_9AGAR|nr:hypothetical protein MSAN_01326200 [Mycena sanguinolenta]